MHRGRGTDMTPWRANGNKGARSTLQVTLTSLANKSSVAVRQPGSKVAGRMHEVIKDKDKDGMLACKVA